MARDGIWRVHERGGIDGAQREQRQAPPRRPPRPLDPAAPPRAPRRGGGGGEGAEGGRAERRAKTAVNRSWRRVFFANKQLWIGCAAFRLMRGRRSSIRGNGLLYAAPCSRRSAAARNGVVGAPLVGEPRSRGPPLACPRQGGPRERARTAQATDKRPLAGGGTVHAAHLDAVSEHSQIVPLSIVARPSRHRDQRDAVPPDSPRARLVASASHQPGACRRHVYRHVHGVSVRRCSCGGCVVPLKIKAGCPRTTCVLVWNEVTSESSSKKLPPLEETRECQLGSRATPIPSTSDVPSPLTGYQEVQARSERARTHSS